MHAGMHVTTVTLAAPRHCPTLNKPARSVHSSAIGSRSPVTQTHNRIEKLVAVAATLVLGLCAGTADAETVSSLGTPGTNGANGTNAQALDTDKSTLVIPPEAPQVVYGSERPGENVQGTTTTVTPVNPPAPVKVTEGTEAVKKPVSRRGRIKELEDIKDKLAKKELELLSKENALLEKEQSITVLRQELEIERKLRELVTKEKEDAEEEALLSKSLCTGSTMLP